MIYVVQTSPGEEMTVRSAMAREDIRAYVPRRSLIIHRNAGWTKIINIIFPCYVFIDGEYSAQLHHKVKSINGVLRFLGAPSPIGADEEKFMRLLFNGGEIIPESSAVVDADGNVTVTDGFLKGKEKYVVYWNIRQKKAQVILRFGGVNHKANLGVEFKRL